MYYVTVTDANGKQASDTCRVAVTGDAVVATFENLYLDSESYWNGPDSKGTPMVGIYGDNQLDGSFVSGSYQFSNNYSLDWNSWQGFAYSNRTATTFTSATPDQYNSVVGHGYDESENYAVVFDKGTITVLNKPEEGDVINGFYITNNAWALDCIKNGNGVEQNNSYIRHGYAATIGGGEGGVAGAGSYHHNLIAHCEGRNWSLSGGLDGNGYYDGHHDVFNNVVYNCLTR